MYYYFTDEISHPICIIVIFIQSVAAPPKSGITVYASEFRKRERQREIQDPSLFSVQRFVQGFFSL
jgi:hypothetical protein